MTQVSITTAYDVTTAFQAVVEDACNETIDMREALDRLAMIRASAEEVGLPFDLRDAEIKLRTALDGLWS